MQRRMDEHDRAARIERFEHRIEPRVTEEFLAVAREQAHALQLELIEAASDLGDRLCGIPHRHDRKRAETLRPARVELSRIVVAAARERRRVLALAKLYAG